MSSKLEMATIIGYRLSPTPKGKLLFAYFLALLDILGMLNFGRRAQPKAFVRAFFASNSLLAHHGRNGNLEFLDNGMVRLSVKGYNHFMGRLDGSNAKQAVERETFDAMVRLIKTGQPQEGLPFSEKDLWETKVQARVSKES